MSLVIWLNTLTIELPCLLLSSLRIGVEVSYVLEYTSIVVVNNDVVDSGSSSCCILRYLIAVLKHLRLSNWQLLIDNTRSLMLNLRIMP